MAKKHRSKTARKLVLLTLVFVLMLVIGYITVWVSLNMRQTLLVRLIIGLSGPVWAVMTIWYIWFKTDYTKLWKRLRNKRNKKNWEVGLAFYPEFEELKQKYPLSVRRHEQHCRHHGISVDEMVEMAMRVPAEEWETREAFRRENQDAHQSYTESPLNDKSNRHRHI